MLPLFVSDQLESGFPRFKTFSDKCFGYIRRPQYLTPVSPLELWYAQHILYCLWHCTRKSKQATNYCSTKHIASETDFPTQFQWHSIEWNLDWWSIGAISFIDLNHTCILKLYQFWIFKPHEITVKKSSCWLSRWR